LTSLLEYLARHLPCEAAYLAVRSGDVFHVQATWKCNPAIQNTSISVNSDAALQNILENGHGLVLRDAAHHRPFALRKVTKRNTRSWLGIPIMIGRQVIGLAAFVATKSDAFTEAHLRQATQRVNQVAYNVENAIILSEVTRYLQQLALLNDLATTAALGIEADSAHPGEELARRVMIRLRRVFNTDWAAVLLLSPDGKTLQEFGGGSLNAPPWIVPVQESLMGLAVENGTPIRVGDLRNAQRHYPIRSNLRSELAVPLKYRGKVIGALVLVSEELNAFTSRDEQLLVVIASQLAGFF
jgi:sigma-B regulation protein RsbU (phosphoserine phosphatase)